jgi:hypothetical protein
MQEYLLQIIFIFVLQLQYAVHKCTEIFYCFCSQQVLNFFFEVALSGDRNER